MSISAPFALKSTKNYCPSKRIKTFERSQKKKVPLQLTFYSSLTLALQPGFAIVESSVIKLMKYKKSTENNV